MPLFLPREIAALIRDYSNRGLQDADRNSNLFGELKTRARGLDPALDRVLDLINAHGPLEQEAVLIRDTATGPLNSPSGSVSPRPPGPDPGARAPRRG